MLLALDTSAQASRVCGVATLVVLSNDVVIAMTENNVSKRESDASSTLQRSIMHTVYPRRIIATAHVYVDAP